MQARAGSGVMGRNWTCDALICACVFEFLKNLPDGYMSFSVFISFFHNLAFQRYKSQLKNLSFIFAFNFSPEKTS
jgi:hypothetical protein